MKKACVICGCSIDPSHLTEFGTVRGNSQRYLKQMFLLWKCPTCASIMAMDDVDLANIYSDYALSKRKLDGFAKSTYSNLLKRLKKVGLQNNSRILDYGCGVGIFLHFMKNQGYTDVIGYDPYVPEYCHLDPDRKFDFVIANDVIEHVEDPRQFMKECARHVAPGGILYIGTTDTDDVQMADLNKHSMRLHQPYHRVLFNETVLKKLADELPQSKLLANYRRSYIDTLVPFANYRFLDELARSLDYNLDRMNSSEAVTAVLLNPRTLFFGFFGYFFPTAAEPAVILKLENSGMNPIHQPI
jgi:SAM-dependent methyltransferase